MNKQLTIGAYIKVKKNFYHGFEDNEVVRVHIISPDSFICKNLTGDLQQVILKEDIKEVVAYD